ncbi:MAG: glycosyltransferase family 2 protein [Dysgonomonas sp.]|nr:glycosyltransferase family 2 protein [Dysgonomonas sp.]
MKVSICIPVYKHVDFLKRCLDSVLIQTFSDYEVIITDDSPNDELERLVTTYQDERIRYIRNKPSLGSPANWNKGLEMAGGDYIKILHHDDWFSLPNSLEAYVHLLDNNPDVDIAFSSSCDIDTNGIKKVHILNPLFLSKIKEDPEFLALGNKLGAPSISIFRNHKGYLFDPDLVWVVDTDFYIRVMKRNSFAFTPEILVNIGVSEHQATYSLLAGCKTRIAEKIYLHQKFDLNDKSSKYRNSLLRVLGREKVFNDASLKKILPNTTFTFTVSDSITSFYYYIKKRVGQVLSK